MKRNETQKTPQKSAECLPRVQCNVINAAAIVQLLLSIIVSHPQSKQANTRPPSSLQMIIKIK